MEENLSIVAPGTKKTYDKYLTIQFIRMCEIAGYNDSEKATRLKDFLGDLESLNTMEEMNEYFNKKIKPIVNEKSHDTSFEVRKLREDKMERILEEVGEKSKLVGTDREEFEYEMNNLEEDVKERLDEILRRVNEMGKKPKETSNEQGQDEGKADLFNMSP